MDHSIRNEIKIGSCARLREAVPVYRVHIDRVGYSRASKRLPLSSGDTARGPTDGSHFTGNPPAAKYGSM